MKQLYFPHDANARFDSKCLELIRRHGYEGYGIYFAILEYLFSQDGYMPDDNTVITAVLPFVITDKITEIKNTLFELNLLQKKENSVIFSERLCYTIRLQKSVKKIKSEAGKKGMNTRWNRDNTVITDGDNTVITDIITKEKKRKEKNRIEIKENKKEKPSNFYFKFIEENCPRLSKLPEQLTDEQAQKLDGRYYEHEIKGILTEMDNYKGISKYVSVYRTALNWLERKYPPQEKK